MGPPATYTFNNVRIMKGHEVDAFSALTEWYYRTDPSLTEHIKAPPYWEGLPGALDEILHITTRDDEDGLGLHLCHTDGPDSYWAWQDIFFLHLARFIADDGEVVQKIEDGDDEVFLFQFNGGKMSELAAYRVYQNVETGEIDVSHAPEKLENDLSELEFVKKALHSLTPGGRLGGT